MATTTNYIWDDQNLLAEADGTNTINVVYTSEPEQYGNLISSRISGATSYHHFDALGSTRQLTNAAGTVTDTMINDSWGNVVNRTGTTSISLLWLGELGYYSDAETSLIYVRRRAYGPNVSRWMSADPILPMDALTWFVYGQNSPALVTDPSGRDPITVLPAAGVVLYGTICRDCLNAVFGLGFNWSAWKFTSDTLKRTCTPVFTCFPAPDSCQNKAVLISPPIQVGPVATIPVCLNCSYQPMWRFAPLLLKLLQQVCDSLPGKRGGLKLFDSCFDCVRLSLPAYTAYAERNIGNGLNAQKCMDCGIGLTCFDVCNGIPAGRLPAAYKPKSIATCTCAALGLTSPTNGCNPMRAN